jgi:serine/threonine-protein kinase
MTSSIPTEFLALQEALAGRYSIERELGRGGMGIVLLARDVALDRLVAIKLLPPDLAIDTKLRERFLREARTAAGLSHPNIVPIHTVEEYGDLVFFVMGYVDGETLRQRVERHGPLTPRFAMKLLQEVAWAIGYAHQRGIVHRDIKPDNIMIEQATERALVTDFGIAQVGPQTDDEPGTVIGTARYMSPEQACGDSVDGRTDLYALGATFFYALTGRAPFEARNLPALLAQHVSEPAPGVRAFRPEVPDRLATVIDTCLAKAPEDRIQSGDEAARLIGEARGREFRAPPLVRNFVRNAEISTMVLLAAAFAGQGVAVGDAGVQIAVGGPGLIGSILIFQLGLLVRRSWPRHGSRTRRPRSLSGASGSGGSRASGIACGRVGSADGSSAWPGPGLRRPNSASSPPRTRPSWSSGARPPTSSTPSRPTISGGWATFRGSSTDSSRTPSGCASEERRART